MWGLILMSLIKMNAIFTNYACVASDVDNQRV